MSWSYRPLSVFEGLLVFIAPVTKHPHSVDIEGVLPHAHRVLPEDGLLHVGLAVDLLGILLEPGLDRGGLLEVL